MSFLLAMLSLLMTTFVSLIINYPTNLVLTPRTQNYFIPTLWLPISFYNETVILVLTWTCLLICGIFILLVT